MKLTPDYPPVWGLGFGAAMWGLARIATWPALDRYWAVPRAGLLLVSIGIAVIFAAAAELSRARTTIVPHETPSALVTTGPYRFSRNPIYAADALILLGWALVLGAAPPLVLVPLFVLVLDRRFVRPEEARLRAAFPGAFAAWAARTRRWL